MRLFARRTGASSMLFEGKSLHGTLGQKSKSQRQNRTCHKCTHHISLIWHGLVHDFGFKVRHRVPQESSNSPRTVEKDSEWAVPIYAELQNDKAAELRIGRYDTVRSCFCLLVPQTLAKLLQISHHCNGTWGKKNCECISTTDNNALSQVQALLGQNIRNRHICSPKNFLVYSATLLSSNSSDSSWSRFDSTLRALHAKVFHLDAVVSMKYYELWLWRELCMWRYNSQTLAPGHNFTRLWPRSFLYFN